MSRAFADAGLWLAAAGVLEEAVFGLDEAGRVEGWNEAARRLFGYTMSEIAGADGQVLFASGPGESFRDRFTRALHGEVLLRLPATARRRDGMLVPISLTLSPLDRPDGVCGVARDVTEQVVAQEALAESHRRQSLALELSKVGFWVWDVESGSVQMSDEMYRIHGLDPMAFEGTMAARIALAHPDDRRRLRRRLRAALAGGPPVDLEYQLIRPDGAQVWVYERATPEFDTQGVVKALNGICQDVTERRRGAEAIRRHALVLELLQRIAVAANESEDVGQALERCIEEICSLFDWGLGHVAILDDDGSVVRHAWHLRMKGDFGAFRRHVEQRLEAELASSSPGPRVLDSPVWLNDVAAWVPRPPLTDPLLRSAFRFPVVVEDRPLAVLETYTSERRERDPQLMEAARHAAIQVGRVVERERSSGALAHQAMHDPLTNLPNRTLFLDRLGQSLGGVWSGETHLAVMFIDLDNFKLINDSLGHNVGDRVLTTVASRLVKAMRSGDTAARFGGDEFIILCERLSNDEAVADIANRLLATIAQPIVLAKNARTVVTASIGIVLASSGAARPDHLLRDADAAMYRAKEEGRGRFHVFDPALHERASRKLSIANEMRSALANGELRLEFQPQVRMSDGRVVGVESLVRWDSPTRGTLGPADWIPIAEETQLIVPIGEWILAEACRTGAQWLKLPPGTVDPEFKIGVNVSAVQLARPELIDTVVAAVSETGIDPASVCLEITESVLMSAPVAYLEALLGLKMVGVSLAVDDFGTGYSSLAYLRRFPIDAIKIDKAFVDDLVSGEERGRSIMKAIVQLATALGVASVAEGVETGDQVEELKAAGCDAAQGFFYAIPGGPDLITDLLRYGQPVRGYDRLGLRPRPERRDDERRRHGV